MKHDFEYINYSDTDRLAVLENRAAELEQMLGRSFSGGDNSSKYMNDVDAPPSQSAISSVASYRTRITTTTRQQVSVADATGNERATQLIDTREREQRLQLEICERRWAIFLSLIAREPMASMVGAIILLALAAALIIGTFTHTDVPNAVTNTFLLVLGYFFGQHTPRTRINRGSKMKDE